MPPQLPARELQLLCFELELAGRHLCLRLAFLIGPLGVLRTLLSIPHGNGVQLALVFSRPSCLLVGEPIMERPDPAHIQHTSTDQYTAEDAASSGAQHE
jgi:hypothetical protein